MNYTYDGTFFGFMSALFAAYEDGITRVGTIGESAETSLFGDCKYIPTEADKAGRVLTGLKNQCGEKAVYYLYYGFLSDIKGKEASLTTYIRRAFIDVFRKRPYGVFVIWREKQLMNVMPYQGSCAFASFPTECCMHLLIRCVM